MKEITDKQIEHLAELSSLNLTTEEKNKMKTDLEQILTFVDAIEALDAANLSVDSAVTTLNELREDIVFPSISQDKALKNAPVQENGAYVVSKVVD